MRRIIVYWSNERASRIDRFYVSQAWIPEFVWVSSTPPPQHSDHQQVELHLHVVESNTRLSKRLQPTYPIQSHQPDRILDNLLREMENKGAEHTATMQTRCRYS